MTDINRRVKQRNIRCMVGLFNHGRNKCNLNVTGPCQSFNSKPKPRYCKLPFKGSSSKLTSQQGAFFLLFPSVTPQLWVVEAEMQRWPRLQLLCSHYLSLSCPDYRFWRAPASPAPPAPPSSLTGQREPNSRHHTY